MEEHWYRKWHRMYDPEWDDMEEAPADAQPPQPLPPLEGADFNEGEQQRRIVRIWWRRYGRMA